MEFAVAIMIWSLAICFVVMTVMMVLMTVDMFRGNF